MSPAHQVLFFVLAVLIAVLVILIWARRLEKRNQGRAPSGAPFPLNPSPGDLFVDQGRVWRFDATRHAWRFERLVQDYIT
jgi:hypothetical protein